ncbi:radical SAM protein [Desulfocurvus vexinensis]|uniref:radical SAM protein n=1 Tax=Desulfocurvus vexinensis TaxID=399548 RepID=UPI00048F6E38|nr:radical SAM protein [Desulfocurvus vexinensis]
MPTGRSIEDIISRAAGGERLDQEQVVRLLECPPDSEQSYRIMHAARALSEKSCAGKPEIHAQFALNLGPCPMNCLYCSFAAVNGIFKESSRLDAEQAVASALTLEQAGANAVYMMTTADYPFGALLEMGREVRRHLAPQTLLIANTGDRTASEARQLKDAGFQGVYHALRLGEGSVTRIPPEKRLKSMRAFREAGLLLGTCVEPVGPEHSHEELAAMILLAASLEPAYSGAARRISIPGTELAKRHGMITELRMAQIVAVTRLATPLSVRGNCTHEPCVIGAAAGANLFWAEIGANPRDTKERTEEGRGFTVDRCRQIFWEAGLGHLLGPSVYYS